jgi:hypothetical protein
MDFSLSSDERDYKSEVIFSNLLIGQDDGTKLPISFDLNSSASTEFYVLNYGEYNPYNNLISENYYNPKNDDLTCFTAKTICDIGLTGTDNGLVENMSGETIIVTEGLFDDSLKFERLYFDRRLKLHQVTGYTQVGSSQFSGLPDTMLFNIVSKLDSNVGVYHELYGGFYQGFYKLHGYDYETFPERMNKGWTVELILKPRLIDEYFLNSGETTLNNFYPQNKNTFFFFGTRAENKYYHNADGEPISGYTRVTSGLTCLETCACCDSGVTTSRCIYVYPPTPSSGETGTTCGWESQTHNCPNPVTTTTTSNCVACQPCMRMCDPSSPPSIEYTCESNPLDDSMSNAISFRLCGDPKNPKIGFKILQYTGHCETTGSCSTTGITYVTGYTIIDLCTDKGIYDDCLLKSQEFLNKERWFLVDIVWERYKYLEDCDLCWKGGLCLITKDEYYESLAGNSVSLIGPNSSCSTNDKIKLIMLNQSWLDEKDFRMGKLMVFVNGRKLQTFENIEEIIPRALYGEKEKQIGVPFNISWGGGTQGLHNHLIFSGCPTTGCIEYLTDELGNYILTENGNYIISVNSPCSNPTPILTYQQDPELFPNNVLSGTSLSALTTNILLEQNFGGTFDGGISQFRMYTNPLAADEVYHNYKILKDKFNLFDYNCPNCCLDNDIIVSLCDVNYEILSAFTAPYPLGRVYKEDKRDQNYLIKNNFELLKYHFSINRVGPTPTPTRTSTRRPTPTPTPTKTSTRRPTPTPTPTKSGIVGLTSKYWDDNFWWGDQGNTPQCVGYAWSHWISDAPIIHSGSQPNILPSLIYTEAQKIDEWPGENYDGTSVRAGAKYLQNTNKIVSYYWGFDIDTLKNTVLNIAPVVVGTNWYYNMFFPDVNGLIKATGYLAGGHAYVINGVDTQKQLFRIKNSWGIGWGLQGHAFISFSDMTKLITQSGEICLAIENNF